MDSEKSDQPSNSSLPDTRAFEELKAKLQEAARRSENCETVDGEAYLAEVLSRLQRLRG